jgi:hypothetical protein
MPKHIKPKRKRNRKRENAGKSEASWQKHNIFEKAASGQINAWHVSHPDGKIAIVDANAGDGEAVSRPQGDLFDDNLSLPTPALAVSLAAKRHADVFLCEKHDAKRRLLKARFPSATILADHALVPARLNGYRYALIISDPNGPGDQGIEYLQAIARQMHQADFIISFCEGFLHRVNGVAPPIGDASDTPQRRAWEVSRQRYLPRLVPQWWTTTLSRRHLARTMLIKASPGYHYRVLVIANYLSHAVQRHPFVEVFP